MTQSIDEALAFTPPSKAKVAKKLGWWEKYFSPTYAGLENISLCRPTLLVGNHTRYGGLDVPLLHKKIYLDRGLFVRVLADRIHYKVPYWRDYVGRNGGVIGSREMCRALMQAGQTIMVFPGGGREVMKGKGADYKLQWRERLGFVRMAIEHGYTITPFSSLGADEAMSVLVDKDDINHPLIASLLERVGLSKILRDDNEIPPISRGIGLSAIPRPEKFYFSIGEPIDAARYSGRQDDRKVLQSLQQKAAAQIESMLAKDMLKRAQDTENQSLARKVLRKL